MVKLTAPFARELKARDVHLTRLDSQFDRDGVMKTHPLDEIRRDVDLGPMLISYRPLEGGRVSAVCFYRRTGAAPFAAREARLAHIVLSEIPWLHLMGWPNKKDASFVRLLSPRLRTVLNLLIQGMSRKEIATALKISVHTLNGYVKDVFRHFDVHGQTALANRFFRGDGGDVP